MSMIFFCNVLTHMKCVDMNSSDAPTLFNDYVKKQKVSATHMSILPCQVCPVDLELMLLTEKSTSDSC